MRRCAWIRPFDRRVLLTFNFILQPAAFWRRSLWEQTGALENAYHWAMDWDWFIRATAVTCPDYVPLELARFSAAAGDQDVFRRSRRAAEIAEISRRHGGFFSQRTWRTASSSWGGG